MTADFRSVSPKKGHRPVYFASNDENIDVGTHTCRDAACSVRKHSAAQSTEGITYGWALEISGYL